MHPAYVALSAIRVGIAILVLGFYLVITTSTSLVQNSSGGGILTVLAVLLIIILLAVTVLVSYIYYKRFTWEITQSDIHIYSGIIFKKQVHIPFQRVQSIDFNAQIIERILGIVKLKIETAGGTQNRGVMIPALKLDQAEALRAEVFARKKTSGAEEEAAMRQKMQTMKAQMSPSATAPAAAMGAASAAVPQFDPQTGKPLVATGAQGASMQGTAAVPQFDPQTGAPLAWAPATSVDRFVDGVGNDLGKLRGLFADNYQEDAPIECEYGLSAKELFLSAISDDLNFTTLISLLVALLPIYQIIAAFTSEADAQDSLGSMASILGVMVVGIIIAVMVFIIILSLLSKVISYGGFKARRRGGRIEVERGLLSRQYRGVAISRIQSVEVKQGFIRRMMGYAELKLLTIDTLASQQGNNKNQSMQARGLVVHPFVKKDKIPGIMAQMLPEFNGRPADDTFRGLPKVSQRRVIIRHTVFIGAIYAVCALFITLMAQFDAFGTLDSGAMTRLMAVLWGLFVLLLAGRLAGSLLWFRHAAYTYNAGMLSIRQGFFSITTTIIPRQKIQWAQTHQNPFQRWAKVSTITALTAAGVGGTRTKLRDVEVQQAAEYLDWVRPHEAVSG